MASKGMDTNKLLTLTFRHICNTKLKEINFNVEQTGQPYSLFTLFNNGSSRIYLKEKPSEFLIERNIGFLNLLSKLKETNLRLRQYIPYTDGIRLMIGR